MWNARLDESQAGIKISRWYINNLRHADDNTLRAESREELKSLLIRLDCGIGEDSWLQGDPTSLSWRKSTLNIHWKDWCWSWSSNTWATWCEELTHWERPWCWERLKAGEGDDRGGDGWMASPTYGHEFEQILEDGEGQGSLTSAVHGVFICKESNKTEWLTKNNKNICSQGEEVGKGKFLFNEYRVLVCKIRKF